MLATHLPINDIHLIDDLLLRSDLSEMPSRPVSAHQLEARYGTKVLAPLLNTFEQHESEFLVHRVDDGVAAALIFCKGFPQETFWWISAIVVRPSERRLGHGSSLISVLKANALAEGVARIGTVSWSTDVVSLSFWRRQGFLDGPKLTDIETTCGQMGRQILFFEG